jgi:hypothetical protein
VIGNRCCVEKYPNGHFDYGLDVFLSGRQVAALTFSFGNLKLTHLGDGKNGDFSFFGGW